MEVWLGTIIACVPTLRPVASNLSSTASKIFSLKSSQRNLMKESDPDPESGHGQTPERNVDDRKFHRLHDDDVPLKSMPLTNGSTAKYLGPSHFNDSRENTDNINVRSDMEVYETRFPPQTQAYESV